MLAELARSENLQLQGESLGINLRSGMRPDGVDMERRTLVEAYAHIGKLKGAQLHKVKGDILKLILLERKLGGIWRKILCFADESEAETARGKSWIAEAVREFEIEVVVTPLPSSLAGRVTEAQSRQRMVNPE